MLFSHPKKALVEHLKNVNCIGEAILNQKRISFSEYSIESITIINRLALQLHDIGKSTPYFQEYILSCEDGKTPLSLNEKLKSHGLLSGVLAFAVVRRVINDDVLAYLVYMLISRHHGELLDFINYSSCLYGSGDNKELVLKQFNSIDKQGLQGVLDNLKIKFDFLNFTEEEFIKDVESINSYKLKKCVKSLQTPETFLLINLLFSILIFSDKLEAIYSSEDMDINEFIRLHLERPVISSSCVEDYKLSLDVKNKDMADARDEIYQDVLNSVNSLDLEEKILSINLPTGAGKTLTAFKVALRLKERYISDKEYNPRIIYVLPFTSVIDQNFDVLSKVLKSTASNVVLKHHYLSQKEYKWENEEIIEYSDSISEHLVESWESEIIVSTFVQLLHSIFTNKNRKLKKFHNIAGSIIILDEVQSIPYRYWKLINSMFKLMAKMLNCCFILMTATMPLIFSEDEGEIYELAKNKEQYFNKFDRITINTDLLTRDITLDEYKEILYDNIIKYSDKSFLIVMNTIKSSIAIYEYLRNEFEDKIEVYYLSTNIIPKERFDRIKNIKESKKRKIIVSTQMIEAGVDIDIHRVYRDFGPMDSINQTAGRCNREWGKEKGIVTLVRLVDKVNEASNKSYFFSDYVYEKILLDEAKTVLSSKDDIAENEIFSLAKSYYKGLKAHGRDSSKRLIEKINSLDYMSAFKKSKDNENYSKSNSKENKKDEVFELIEDEFETIDVFIETEQEAVGVWEEYRNALRIDNRFERRHKLNEIKFRLNQYVISVPKRVLIKHIEISDKSLTRIPYERLSTIYDENTGFIRKELKDYFC